MRIAPVAEIKAQLSAFIKASEESPVVVTRNGKPVAVLIGTSDEDEIERLILAHSKKLRAVLEAAEMRIQATGGIPHDEFWRQVDAEYDAAPDAHRNDSGEEDLRYHHLVSRPDNDRRQAYLKGHDMTVGELVYTMRANSLSAEEAAADLNLPLAQVREAQAYYEVHRELVEADAEEEKRLLEAQEEAQAARIRASLEDLKAGRVKRGTAEDLIRELNLED
jgi:prevent-host-death family protein